MYIAFTASRWQPRPIAASVAGAYRWRRTCLNRVRLCRRKQRAPLLVAYASVAQAGEGTCHAEIVSKDVPYRRNAPGR